LAGHVQINVRCAYFPEALLHHAACQLGFVAFTAEVAEVQMAQVSRHELLDGIGRRAIRKMPVPAEDSLFQAPGTMRTILQHLDIVIGLDEDNVRRADALDDEPGRMAEIGKNADSRGAGVQQQSDWILGVMRDGEGFDQDITELESRAGAEQAAIEPALKLALQCFARVAIAINGNIEFQRQQSQALDVIGMFVRDKNAGEIFGSAPDAGHSVANLTPAQAGVDKDASLVGFEIRAIAR
jgi:hypothetical protein